MSESRQESRAETESIEAGSAAVLTLRQGLSPARLRLDLALDSVMALPTGAAYTAGDRHLRLTATRSPGGVILEAEADSTGPELTLVQRSGARLTASRNEEKTDEHKETKREAPWQPAIIAAAAIGLLITILTIIRQLTK